MPDCKTLWKTRAHAEANSMTVAISPDGRYVASCGDNNVAIFDAASGKKHAILKGHSGTVYAIAFSPDASPYWYTDTNGNGKIDPDELKPANAYRAYTPRLLQAVYNYTFALRDPGAAYHNGRYTAQLLHDALESLTASGSAGGDMGGRSRP